MKHLLLLILFLVPCEQTSLKSGGRIKIENNEANPQSTYKAPFIVLMSSDEVTVQEFPLMENGNLNVLYRLSSGNDFSEPDEDGYEEELVAEEEEATEDGAIGIRDTGADAHDYEQMAQITSLGKKSELQQQSAATNVTSAQLGSISVGPAHASPAAPEPEQEPAPTTAKGAPRTQTAAEEEESVRNSVTGTAISSSVGSSSSSSSWPSPSSTTTADPGAHSLPSAGSPAALSHQGRAKFCDFDVHMSSGYAFVADSRGKIHRFRLTSGRTGNNNFNNHDAGYDVNNHPTASEIDYTNMVDDGAKFDSAPAGFNGNRQLQHQQGQQFAARNRNSTTNAFTSGGGGNNVPDTIVDDHHSHIGDATSESDATDSDANKVSSKADYSVLEQQQQKQSGNSNGRQHPTISAAANQQRRPAGDDAEPSGSKFGAASFGSSKLAQTRDAPISGASNSPVESEWSQTDSQLRELSGAEPRIIWSRSKRRLPALSPESHQANTRPRSSSANVKGALPAYGNQVANGTEQMESADGPMRAANSNHQQHQLNGAGQLKNEENDAISEVDEQLERQPAKLAATNASIRHRDGTHLRTEITVDWLNHLLFVLDKYRLFVVDFDGNNELLLIDDFDARNRPVDIKVDPVNDLLFWLQVGTFRNTIYKLDLGVLSMPSAMQRMVDNTLRQRQSGRNLPLKQQQQQAIGNTSQNNGAFSFDSSELVALVSHHYAHPIITDLPRQATLFTIDHKHSRIYVPLLAPPSNEVPTRDSERNDAEVFAPSDNALTHLNNTDLSVQFSDNNEQNCNTTTTSTGPGAMDTSAAVGRTILAYNLDGTDVGPFRSLGGNNNRLDTLGDIQDITLDSKEGLLYWLTKGGKELFQEYKTKDPGIHAATHTLDGKSFSKLTYFDDTGYSQPTDRRPRLAMSKLFKMLSSSTSSPNRWIRSEKGEQFEEGGWSLNLNGRHRIGSEADASHLSKNAPFIILGVTCLIVLSVYLIWALIFQQTNNVLADDENGHPESISESSMNESRMDCDSNANGFLNPNTISRWVMHGSVRSTNASTFNRTNVGSCDIESNNYRNESNAVDEHYRETNGSDQQQQSSCFFGLDTSQLANLSEWPTNMHDMSNKLYVPVEVLHDDALSKIPRVSIDQLEIERRAPLGEGHFGTVLQGTIKCSLDEKDHLLNKTQLTANGAPISPGSSLLPQPARNHSRLPISSTPSSSGHGSSSSASTSCDFAKANSCCTSNTNGDYLTPKSQCNSTMSDYEVDNPISSDSYSSSYCATSVSHSNQDGKHVQTKLQVAIKKLKENASSEEKRDFLQEAKLLDNFHHPNIVRLLGICLDRGSTLIVMELMLGGDLIRYMQENTPTKNNPDNLTYDDLLKICLDIVNGCCYLEGLDYIHRDLAARNCLVSSRKREERVVKLADFGLARDIYKDSYYKKLNDSAMPLKWMAPECLIEQKFTKKSDVWSFGVVMWEVMSYCQEKPYGGVEPFFMKEHLTSGARLKKPDNCDDNMYKLMNRCWQLDPERRPTFQECRHLLIEIRNGAKCIY